MSFENSSNFSLFAFSLLSVVTVYGAMNVRAKCSKFGFASWKTPEMLGNSFRSPIYPYMRQPFYEDIEVIRDYLRLN